jgi:thioredoxin reductase
MTSRKRVVIVGSSFAGLTAALELRRRVGDKHVPGFRELMN